MADKKKQKVENMSRADIRAILEVMYNSPKISAEASNGATEMSGEEFKEMLTRAVGYILDDVKSYGVKLI